jgi:hypothetical protein
MSVPKVFWADFKFPPLNLWNMPLHQEIVDKMNQYYYEHYMHLWEKDMNEENDGMASWFEHEHLRNQREANREDSITNDVVNDLRVREQFGALKYGKFLTPHTTENLMQHLYEELLDAALYIKTEMKKREAEQAAKVPFNDGTTYRVSE